MNLHFNLLDIDSATNRYPNREKINVGVGLDLYN
jgi:hypothetical protein